MNDIKISYQRSGSDKAALTLSRKLPSSWSELTPAQAWRCIDHLMTDGARIDILKDLLKLPTRVWDDIGTGDRWDMLELLDWMNLDPQSTAPVAPYVDIKVSGGRYERLYLPAASFNNVTGLEYSLIDDYYADFINHDDVDAECKMIAFMLRPASVANSAASPAALQHYAQPQRIKLSSPGQINAWLPLIKLLPLSIRTYMTMLISANRADFHDRYGDFLFEKPSHKTDDDMGIPDQDDDGVAGFDIGWHASFMDIAADGVFGTYDDVCHTAHHTLCIYMCRKVQEARDRQMAHDHALARMES